MLKQLAERKRRRSVCNRNTPCNYGTNLRRLSGLFRCFPDPAGLLSESAKNARYGTLGLYPPEPGGGCTGLPGFHFYGVPTVRIAGGDLAVGVGLGFTEEVPDLEAG
jgi:hypothetical protein